MTPTPIYPRVLPVGDSAVTVEFGDEISPELNQAVVQLDIALAAAEIEGIIETVPSYRSLLICYDPMEISHADLVIALHRLISRDVIPGAARIASWTIPVIYDPPFGDDLAEAARLLNLTEDAVIRLHCDAEYRVYMVGFAPGLPYLGRLPDALHISRRDVPRPMVPEGSVVIGGMQCAIASIPLPTAWYKLGQTPLKPFEAARRDPFLFRAGDRVRFRRIDAAEYRHLAALDTGALLPLVRTAA